MLQLLSVLAYGQAYEAQPCVAEATLRASLAAGMVGGISPRGPAFRLAVSTSLLPPPSSLILDPEAVRATFTGELGDDENLAVVVADARSCTYGAPNLLDGDPASAWCEGAPGPGVDEVVILELPPGKLEVRNGYGRSPERFAQNGRVRRVEVTLLGSGWEPPVQGTLYAGLPVMGRHEVELADTAEWQPLALPAAKMPVITDPPGPPGAYPMEQQPKFVALRVLSVWPGQKWEDTCLSELRGVR